MSNILLVTKGHPFEREPFFDVFDHLRATAGITHTHVEQPAAQHLFHPSRLAPYDVVVCYDMPGIEFTRSGDPTASPVRFEQPPAEYVAGFESCLEAGVPLRSGIDDAGLEAVLRGGLVDRVLERDCCPVGLRR